MGVPSFSGAPAMRDQGEAEVSIEGSLISVRCSDRHSAVHNAPPPPQQLLPFPGAKPSPMRDQGLAESSELVVRLTCSDRYSAVQAPPPPQQLPPFPGAAPARISEHREYDECWDEVQPSSAPPAVPPALPAGWEMLTDTDGDTYYHSTQTGEVSWEVPTAPSAAAVVPPPLAAGSPPLPEGWEELTDGDGDVYFHHTSTGETSWDRPC